MFDQTDIYTNIPTQRKYININHSTAKSDHVFLVVLCLTDLSGEKQCYLKNAKQQVRPAQILVSTALYPFHVR